jgi:hypothetical protein
MRDSDPRRNLLGVIALVALLAGAVLYFVDGAHSRYLEWTSACLRVGAVLGAVWLAMPEFRRPGNRWLVAAILAGFVVLAWRPRLFLVAAVLFVVAWFLRPRGRMHHGGTETRRGEGRGVRSEL